MNKPEYFFNLSQLANRLKYRNKNRKNVSVKIKNSKYDFFVNESEVIGKSILTIDIGPMLPQSLTLQNDQRLMLLPVVKGSVLPFQLWSGIIFLTSK